MRQLIKLFLSILVTPCIAVAEENQHYLGRFQLEASVFERKEGVFFPDPTETIPTIPTIASPSPLVRERPCSGPFGIYDWMSSEKIPGSKEAINQWLHSTQDGRLFDCEANRCITIIDAEIHQKDNESRKLAACEITNINNTIGAPTNCKGLYNIGGDKEYIMVRVGTKNLSCLVGLPDFDFSVIANLEKGDKLRDAIHNAFRLPPLSFETTVYDKSIIATSSYRVSPILSPYREVATVRIDLLQRKIDNTAMELMFRLATTLYVNLQNTSSPSDWHLPDDQQQKRYVEALRKEIGRRVEAICLHPDWMDTTTLFCDSERLPSVLERGSTSGLRPF